MEKLSIVETIMKALLPFLLLIDFCLVIFSHSFTKNDKLIGKVPYPYKMQSLGHDPDNGIKNTYQGESYGNIYIVNHPGYGNDIVIHNYPAGGK